jgi:hypothetical protein
MPDESQRREAFSSLAGDLREALRLVNTEVWLKNNVAKSCFNVVLSHVDATADSYAVTVRMPRAAVASLYTVRLILSVY